MGIVLIVAQNLLDMDDKRYSVCIIVEKEGLLGEVVKGNYI